MLKQTLTEIVEKYHFLSSAMCRTKIETTILDILAFEIEIKLQNGSYTEREPLVYEGRKRADLVVRDKNGVIKTVCEFKHLYSFDITKFRGEGTPGINKSFGEDMKKLQSLGNQPEKYFVVLFSHYHSKVVPENFKYSSKHNAVMRDISPDDLLLRVEEQMNKYYKSYNFEYFKEEMKSYHNIPLYLLGIVIHV